MRSDTRVTQINRASARARARRRMQELAPAARTAAITAADPDAFHPTYHEPSRGGQAWLNGTQIGRRDQTLAHLTRAYE